MKTLSIRNDDQAWLRERADTRPGVAEHRIADATFQLGKLVVLEREELLDEQLARMDQAARRRRSTAGVGQGREDDTSPLV